MRDESIAILNPEDERKLIMRNTTVWKAENGEIRSL